MASTYKATWKRGIDRSSAGSPLPPPTSPSLCLLFFSYFPFLFLFLTALFVQFFVVFILLFCSYATLHFDVCFYTCSFLSFFLSHVLCRLSVCLSFYLFAEPTCAALIVGRYRDKCCPSRAGSVYHKYPGTDQFRSKRTVRCPLSKHLHLFTLLKDSIQGGENILLVPMWTKQRRRYHEHKGCFQRGTPLPHPPPSQLTPPLSSPTRSSEIASLISINGSTSKEIDEQV